MDLAKTTLKHAGRFGSGTLISRGFALIRDVLMAAILGSGPEVAAFFMAFRFSNIMRRILGEGAMQAAMVPIFEELRVKDERQAALFFRSTWLAVSAALIVIISIIELCLGSVLLLGWGGARTEVIRLTMIMTPGLLFICWYGIQSALCSCYGHFFVPAVAPAAFNIVWIGSLVLLRDQPAQVIVAMLATSIVLAYAFQWSAVFQITRSNMRRILGREWWKASFGPLAPLKRLLAPLTLGLIGVSAAQLNSLIDAWYAQLADPSGPAYLWYAIRLEQVPVGMIGVALSSAALPPLARCLAQGKYRDFAQLIRASIVKSGQATLMCSALFFTIGYSLIDFVFCRGAFTTYATTQSSICLWAYALGLTPQTWVILLTPAFYAAKDYRTPSIAAIWSLASNLIFNATLVQLLGCGAVSIALATGVASLFNLWWLVRKLPGTLSASVWSEIARFVMPVTAATCAGIAVGVLWESPTLPILFGRAAEIATTPSWIKPARFVSELATFFAVMIATGALKRWRQESNDPAATFDISN